MFLHTRIKLSRSQDEPAPAEGSETSDQLLASSAEDVRARRSTTAQMQPMANFTHMTQQYMGRLAYRYFNWRQDTWNDLQLFATINTVLLFLVSVLKAKVIDPLDNEADNSVPSFQHFWQSVYEALVVVFGQDLPDTTASLLQQLWALMVAAVGLAAFALVLALVEQVVLEVLKNNVQRGSQVYEEGHVSRTFQLFLHFVCVMLLLNATSAFACFENLWDPFLHNCLQMYRHHLHRHDHQAHIHLASCTAGHCTLQVLQCKLYELAAGSPIMTCCLQFACMCIR